MATSNPQVTTAQGEPVPSTDAASLPAAEKPSAAEQPLASLEEQPRELPTSAGPPAPSTPQKHIAEERAVQIETVNTTEVAEDAEPLTVEPISTTEEGEKPISAGREEIPPLETEDIIEESFYLKDLKASQKKALLQLKAKIQAAIMDNTFLDPPKPVNLSKYDAKEATSEEAEDEKTEEKTEEDGQPLADIATDEPSGDEQTGTESVTIPESTRDISLEPTPGDDVTPTPTMEKTFGPTPSEEVHDDGDESPSLDDLALWGIPLLHSKGDKRTDVLLLKFLRARDFKAEKALNMLQDTMAWRKAFGIDNLIDEEIPAEFLGSFIHGMDREGHPVCYNGELSSKKSVEDEVQLKKRIQVLEKGIKTLDFSPNGIHSMVQVIDFSGHSPAFLGRGLRSKILDLLQNNYPEFVSKQIFVNVPWYFPRLLSLFNPQTRSKVVLAKPRRVAETLFKYISPDQVPVQYGGLSRLNDTTFTGIEAPVTHVIVKAGEKQSIELPLPNAGKLVWDITVIGWEVLYEEEFVPDEGYIKVVQKASRIAANEEAFRNTYIADEPGKVVITVDNTTSRKRRVVVYRSMSVAS
ncbi:hypothetical protein L7F22_059150 [Adiantum nelumboides]|nr:hypothetical protein [Adiantum nelumboides]